MNVLDSMDLESLIQRAKNNDPIALDIIYRNYHAKMLGICLNIIKYDKEIASDLVHDAFVMAFVSIVNLRDNSKFYEWMVSIVKNISLKYVEHRRRIQMSPISACRNDDTAFIDTVSSPESDVYHKELLELINQLPEGYRQILKLSVIEGFSHQEIASMLGIAPHSSSSQLSRARRYLKRMLERKAIVVVGLVISFLSTAYIFIMRKNREEFAVDTQLPEEYPSTMDSIIEQQKNSVEYRREDLLIPPIGKKTLTKESGNKIVPIERDSVVIPLDTTLVAEATKDSVRSGDKYIVESLPKIDLAGDIRKRNNKWQISVTSSFGPTLAQNTFKPIDADYSGFPEPDFSVVLPKYIHTWEDYSDYLMRMPSFGSSQETMALFDIASHNSGKIEQTERHSFPITFSLSLNRAFSERFSLGTGIQYSILRSQFTMGKNGNSIVEKQDVHYLGIPLQVSYQWFEYKRFSSYVSLGVTLNIPVYASQEIDYLVQWQSQFSQSNRNRPPIQWQVGAGFGVQYQLGRNTAIFVESTFNWFVPSDTGIRTKWTEQPFVITCPIGIRLSW